MLCENFVPVYVCKHIWVLKLKPFHRVWGQSTSHTHFHRAMDNIIARLAQIDEKKELGQFSMLWSPVFSALRQAFIMFSIFSSKDNLPEIV